MKIWKNNIKIFHGTSFDDPSGYQKDHFAGAIVQNGDDEYHYCTQRSQDAQNVSYPVHPKVLVEVIAPMKKIIDDLRSDTIGYDLARNSIRAATADLEVKIDGFKRDSQKIHKDAKKYHQESMAQLKKHTNEISQQYIKELKSLSREAAKLKFEVMLGKPMAPKDLSELKKAGFTTKEIFELREKGVI